MDVACTPGDNVKLDVLRDAPGPPPKLRVRLTVPLKPLTLVRVTIDVSENPAGKLREEGFEETVKSGAELTVTVIVIG